MRQLTFSNLPGQLGQFLSSRKTWMQFNRIVAWGMTLFPVFAILFHINFNDGLMMQLSLLVVHGALSLLLFSLPKLRNEAFSFDMHVMGFRPAALGVRQRFLLTGYRVALAWAGMLLANLPTVGPLAFVLLYPVLRLPVSLCQHLYQAGKYAFARWRWPALLIACLAPNVVLLYLALSLVHILGG